jgi:hypothetical protein
MDFDVRELLRGECLEVYWDAERCWRPARFDISTAGVAFVELKDGSRLRLEQALLTGIRRVFSGALSGPAPSVRVPPAGGNAARRGERLGRHHADRNRE